MMENANTDCAPARQARNSSQNLFEVCNITISVPNAHYLIKCSPTARCSEINRISVTGGKTRWSVIRPVNHVSRTLHLIDGTGARVPLEESALGILGDGLGQPSARVKRAGTFLKDLQNCRSLWRQFRAG